jgi:hypothetical protein
MCHTGYTLATLCFPTPHPHICYSFLSHTSHHTFANQKCATFVTLWLHSAYHTTSTLFLYTFLSHTSSHTFANQKCATFVTLWLHSTLPPFSTTHFLHFATLIDFPCPTLLSHTFPHFLLHFCGTLCLLSFATLFHYTVCYTFVHCWATLLLHSCPTLSYTFCYILRYTFATLCYSLHFTKFP